MPPSRGRNNSSLLESSTIITANLIMASSYLLSKITPRAAQSSMQSAPPAPARPPLPAAAPTWATRSVEPTIRSKTVFVAPDEGEDGKVDQQAGIFIRKFRERTQSDIIARMEAEAAAAVAAARPPPPPGALGAGNFAGTTVYGYYR